MEVEDQKGSLLLDCMAETLVVYTEGDEIYTIHLKKKKKKDIIYTHP